MAPIRVLHILQRMEAAGIQAFLMNLYRNIDRTKVQFDFLVEYPERYFYDDEIEALGGRIFYSTVRVDFNLLRFRKRLREVFSAYPYRIVHVHASNVGWLVFREACQIGLPVRIAHSHNNGAVHDVKFLPKWILQKLFHIGATHLFACSEAAGKYMYGNSHFTVLKNAIDAEKFRADSAIRAETRKELGLSDSFVVGHAGRFHPQKNHKFLIRIFDEIRKKRPNAKLLLIGSGPLEQDIRRQVENLGLTDKTIFLSNRSDMNRLYQAMDVFLFPSLFEGVGIVAVEAQASGVAVVCSDKVSEEAGVSPLFQQLPFSAGVKTWRDVCLKMSEHPLCETDMRSYITASGYDIRENASWLERFYCQKAKEPC